LLTLFAPKKRVASFADIDIQALRRAGIRGIITDLDNTLVQSRAPQANAAVIAWFERLQAEGFKVVVVSNNNYRRVAKFCAPLAIPFIHAARKPTSRGFKKSLKLLGLTAHETAVVGDQILTDVLGGNRLGMYTILVQPCSPHGEALFTKINRRIEKIAIRQMRKKGIFPKEEQR
jgi:HAD superfamily phosphatase (TIGR01668 family)